MILSTQIFLLSATLFSALAAKQGLSKNAAQVISKQSLKEEKSHGTAGSERLNEAMRSGKVPIGCLATLPLPLHLTLGPLSVDLPSNELPDFKMAIFNAINAVSAAAAIPKANIKELDTTFKAFLSSLKLLGTCDPGKLSAIQNDLLPLLRRYIKASRAARLNPMGAWPSNLSDMHCSYIVIPFENHCKFVTWQRHLALGYADSLIAAAEAVRWFWFGLPLGDMANAWSHLQNVAELWAVYSECAKKFLPSEYPLVTALVEHNKLIEPARNLYLARLEALDKVDYIANLNDLENKLAAVNVKTTGVVQWTCSPQIPNIIRHAKEHPTRGLLPPLHLPGLPLHLRLPLFAMGWEESDVSELSQVIRQNQFSVLRVIHANAPTANGRCPLGNVKELLSGLFVEVTSREITMIQRKVESRCCHLPPFYNTLNTGCPLRIFKKALELWEAAWAMSTLIGQMELDYLLGFDDFEDPVLLSHEDIISVTMDAMRDRFLTVLLPLLKQRRTMNKSYGEAVARAVGGQLLADAYGLLSLMATHGAMDEGMLDGMDCAEEIAEIFLEPCKEALLKEAEMRS